MKTAISIYFIAFALLLLSACKVSKDITVPNNAAPVAFRNATSTDTVSIATIQWKEFFTNKHLQ